MDYAMRNLAFDDDITTITAFLDWDDVAIIPFILCSKYVAEIHPDWGGEDWERETGGFSSIQPPAAEGVTDEELENVFQRRLYAAAFLTEKKRMEEERTTATGEWQAVANPMDRTPEPNEEDTDEEDAVSSDSEDVEEEVDSEEERRLQDECDRAFERRELVFYDHFRKEYRKRLERLDPRFATPGFWKMAEDALKIHHLVTYGAEEWIAYYGQLRVRAMPARE
ncbi:PKL/CAK/Fmp29-like protein kinase subdomain-containing protein [Coprinopsis cinerea okayama7|uniref:PKL/CAK/Fmp29-like protein kinase subdomain-containing protein n=1 Tax=Coprinopsis cinerea (strain Okayama-7 / 130 / ATCC MYA-4618 / FGSC 9003) TaxID=240176 RepID=A8NLY0_COPC7|nr:PKL/CAK/Fmp29-like protein kinase subdomain-containing protein [Coprinopsis cinerea okayama7\|eukprot:XP_001834798.2 PKL/CAK/Fmp29-like protein kinase subdomain-containing protein [Coprinopsis cinerea okayama7\